MLKDLWKICSKSFLLYFKNFFKFTDYMLFPVFGQIFGIILVLGVTFIYTQNILNWSAKLPILNNVMLVFLILLVLVLPGFFIFCKAFWDYMTSLIALNTMSNTLLTSGSLTDLVVHKELARRRTPAYIVLLFILAVIYMVGILPIFWVFLALFAVYSALVFQVFAIDENSSPWGAIKGSFTLVKSEFLKTFLLLIIMFAVTYQVFPYLVNMFFDFFGVSYFAAKFISPMFQMLPVEAINQAAEAAKLNYKISPLVISEMVFSSFVSMAVIGFTLPLRCLCFTALYKETNNIYGKPEKQLNKKAK